MKDELQNKIIERIDAEKIKPLPCWRFTLLRGLFWIFAALSVIVGGFAIGAILFLISDLYVAGMLIPEDTAEFLAMFPYLWIIVFISFVLIARVSMRHTKKGYKYSLRFIITVSALSSFILGAIFFTTGIGKLTHKFLNENSVYHYTVHDAKGLQIIRDRRLREFQQQYQEASQLFF
jgi:hypothetical protein